MVDLVIRPTVGAGNKIIIQDQAGQPVLTTQDSGATLVGITGTLSEIPAGTSGNLLTSDGSNWVSAAPSTIANDTITLGMMAGGTDGQIITYNSSGDPVAVGPGADGQVLTSTGAGSSPAFEDVPVFTMPAGTVLKVSSYAFGTAYSTTSMSWQTAGSSVTHQVTNAGCALLVLIDNISLALSASGYTGSNVYCRFRTVVDGTGYNRLTGAIKNGSGQSNVTPSDWCPFNAVSFNEFITGLSLTAGQNVVFQPQLRSSNSFFLAKMGDPYTNGTLTILEVQQ